MIIITDENLNGAGEKIAHGFFGRQGGVSKGIYDSLNCGPGSADEAAAVSENRARVADHFGAPPDHLATVWQVHSPDCLVIKEAPPEGQARPKADAMATDVTGVVLGVLTADCGPVLFAGEKADGSAVIGAAHAGWGGALKGDLENTIQQMMALGAEADSLRAAVGPCIGPASYEVSQGYEIPFLERDPQDERFFKAARQDGHLMFDLPGYIASRLAQAGVKQVTITGQDTYGMEEEFFSYRRATHRGEADYGRQISAIYIKR